ncbi:MAG: hypothetical protein IKR52_04620 [Paludibacteraceae bacterium]|jgi:hypothetical protein|nr:hypothetical protein [Paludibacteraceae bacterium]MBR6310464.1 hypothetical protein [Paludibacteraceae bacterium]MDD6357505.1 hypothetical protein [Bacteroidales bacterium]
MKDLKKYLGVIIILIAVIILITPALCGNSISSNVMLITVLILLIIGLLTHIFVNKKFK